MSQAGTLSRRERQIMDALYKHGQATVTQVLQDLPDPPSYSAVRALLRVLEEKGQVRHRQDGKRYVFLPKVSRDRARRAALRHVLRTYFDGSCERLLVSLLQDAGRSLSRHDLAGLAARIAEAQRARAGRALTAR